MSTDVHTLSGAYALNALEPEEAAEFRQHLDGCQACRDEVRELQRAAAQMGAAESMAPPPDLKARILAAADRTPQEPPSNVRTLSTPRTVTGPGTTGAATGGSTSGTPRRWLTWMATAAAAVIIVGGGAFGLQSLGGDDVPPLSQAAVKVFEADDARTATVETANGGELTVGVSPSRNEMAVDTRNLPELDSEHVYQLWAVHGEEMISAAILSDPEVGAAMGMPEAQTQVAVTVEPKGGSEQPTTDPIVQVDPYEVLES